jgi:ATP-dependent protease ClpP protease subunit
MRLVQNRFTNDGNILSTVMNVEENKIYIEDLIFKSERYWYAEEEKPKENEVTSEHFLNYVRNIKGDVEVFINSQGGNVQYSLSIYNALRECEGKVTTIVTGYAYSCASWILLAGEERFITPGGIVMTHNPSMYAFVDSEDAFNALLAEWKANKTSVIELTSDRTGLGKDTVAEMMNKATFMTAKEAIKNNFCTGIRDGKASIPVGVKNYLPSEISNAVPEFVDTDYSDLLSRSMAISTKKLLRS